MSECNLYIYGLLSLHLNPLYPFSDVFPLPVNFVFCEFIIYFLLPEVNIVSEGSCGTQCDVFGSTLNDSRLARAYCPLDGFISKAHLYERKIRWS